jgi:predicted alpha/beta-hydrolase family hydrolase
VTPGIRELKVPIAAGSTVTARVYEGAAPSRDAALILAHGAGAGHDSPFMVAFAGALAGRGIPTITFNFAYTEQRRRVPDRPPLLEACYRSVVEQVRREVPAARRALFIGGKSMGGRIATHIATDPRLAVAGVVLLGYPLHPPGRPEERRDAHLIDVHPPILFVQGSRDTFGTPAELESVLSTLGDRAALHVVSGGDHSFKVPKAGLRGQAAIMADVQKAIGDWMRAVDDGRVR